MNYNKNIKSIIRKHLLKEDACPTGWTRVPPNTPQDTSKFEYSSDGKCYKQKPESSSNTSELPEWVADYPCLKDIGEIKETTSDTQVYYSATTSDDDSFYFNKDFTLRVYSYDDVKKYDGTWKCVNGKLLIKTPSNNKQWTKAKGWHDIPKVSKYTKCAETLPIKQWCKNDTIKQVQACLKMPIEWQTGNFGRYTKGYLESRDQNGITITTDTITNVCGPNHPLVTGSSGSSGTSGSGTSGTSGTGKVVTGYEDYVKDEIPEE